MFDNDQCGVDASIMVAENLKPGKARICRLPLKDANEMLLAGRGNELAQSVFTAPIYLPDSIKSVADFTAEEIQSLEVKGVPWPWPLLNEKLRSLRQSRLYTLAAKEKSGKTTFTKELALHFLDKNVKVGLIYLEESAISAAVSLYAMYNKTPFCDVEEDLSLLGGAEEIQKGIQCFRDKGLYIYDHKGRYDVSTLRSRLRYMALGLGCDLIILDNLSISIAGMDGDERRGIDLLVNEIKSLIEETTVSIINVVHLVKNRTGKDGEESKVVESKDVHGSGAFAKFSNALLAIEPYSAGTVRIKVLSNRDGGRNGYADVLQYCQKTGRLVPVENALLLEEEVGVLF
jgi:twinkle protein